MVQSQEADRIPSLLALEWMSGRVDGMYLLLILIHRLSGIHSQHGVQQELSGPNNLQRPASQQSCPLDSYFGS